MNKHNRTHIHNASPRGFTLIELLVAISVLIVVILATSRIFGTASQVTGMGQASAIVMQEAAALERRLREDIAHLSHEGFFAIRQVAVPNDVNVAGGGALLNPFLPNDAIIRADQLVFFTTNLESPQTLGVGDGNNDLVRGQGTVSRVYYGHGVQYPFGEPAQYVSSAVSLAHDPGQVAAYPNNNFNHLFDVRPWKGGAPAQSLQQMVRTRIATSGSGSVYARSNQSQIDGTQPDALSWLLCRQAILLVDDDSDPDPASDSKTVYLNEIRAARSIFIDHPGHGATREVRNARVDGAATRPNDIRRHVERITLPNGASGAVRDWNNPAAAGGVNGDQRSIIASSIYYPRAERHAPSARRVDQALTNNVIGSGVSSFIVEWTWEEGTGEVRDEMGNLVPAFGPNPGLNDYYYGFRTNCWNQSTGNWCQGFTGFEQPEQPWFGLNWPERGVGFMGFDDRDINDVDSTPTRNFWQRANFRAPQAVYWTNTMNNAANNIERYFGPGQLPAFNPYGTGNNIRIYEALFGYNRNTPLDRFGDANFDLGYTPWPSAIRVTVVLHDPAGRMEHGREFQFVIDLPRRAK